MYKKPTYAVMGSPIDHSLSPLIHQYFAATHGLHLDYLKLAVAPGQFQAAVEAFFAAGGRGLNVTSPFKREAYALCEAVWDEAKHAKAVNTLWATPALVGQNTDGLGLCDEIAARGGIARQRFLIIGSGGAVMGIIPSLLSQNPQSISVLSRAPSESLRSAFPQVTHLPWGSVVEAVDVVIVGLPLMTMAAYQALLSQEGKPHYLQLPGCTVAKTRALWVMDLNYCPDGNTPLVKSVLAAGGQAIDGLNMLIRQAAYAFEIWHQVPINVEEAINALHQTLGRAI